MRVTEFGGNLHTFHVDSNGLLVWNVFALTGGRPSVPLNGGSGTVTDKVVQSSRRANSNPDISITPESGGYLLHVGTELSNGNGDHVYYFSNDGWWRNASGATFSV